MKKSEYPRCKDCSWWNYIDTDPVFYKYKGVYGSCEKLNTGYEFETINDGEAKVVDHGDILCDKNFGCVLWEKRIK